MYQKVDRRLIGGRCGFSMSHFSIVDKHETITIDFDTPTETSGCAQKLHNCPILWNGFQALGDR
jgi:hypothetical protein